MSALRSMVVFAWMVVTVIPFGTGLLLAAPFLKSDRLWWWFAVPWLRGVIGAARWVAGVRYRVTGAEHLPGPGDMRHVILVSKHQSTWETFFFPSRSPRSLAFVFKRELLRIPLFGWCLKHLDMICIDRSKRAEAWNRVASQGRELMDRGKWVIMFPEGTRSERGGQGTYKTGASRLAIDTGACLIPIAVTSGRCWPRRTFWMRPGRIDVSIGPPIDSAGKTPTSLMSEAEAWIEEEMRRIDPQAYGHRGTRPPPAEPADA